MAIHYEVPAGQSLLIEGPANVVVKTGDVPTISESPASPDEQEANQAPRKKTK